MYPREALLRAIHTFLGANPRAPLRDVAASCGVSVATVKRVLASSGTSFRAVRAAATNTAEEGVRGAVPPLTRKQIAALLGFPSQGALSHFERRRVGDAAAPH